MVLLLEYNIFVLFPPLYEKIKKVIWSGMKWNIYISTSLLNSYHRQHNKLWQERINKIWEVLQVALWITYRSGPDATPPAPPHQSMTSFHQQGCHPLIGSAKARRHVFTSFCFSKLNFKIQSSLRSILMWCDFFPPLLEEGLSVFHMGWEARREEWKGGLWHCASYLHTHTQHMVYGLTADST